MKIKLRTWKFWPSYLFKVSLFGLYTAITLNTGITLAATFAKLNKWQFNPKSQQLEITLSAATKPEYFYLPQPPRLVVDLPNTQLGKVNTLKNYPGTIQRIRVSQFSPNITRIVIDLEPGTFIDPNQVQLQPISPNNPTRWVLRPVISYDNTITQPISSPLPDNQLSPAPLITLPPPSTNLPLTTTNSQQPFVTVPPLNSQDPSQLSNLIIIPADSLENSHSITVPNSENYSDQILNIPVIEFGQPLPPNQ
ncbi:AMIN domain-containing protein [Anabaena lutea]|uniref:AMIN domain-containing protein n=1 Tax=Anabaena lutea FACHB-196 TaxID=2692881 RepID=A0ABR8FGM6_9NOST|nr:AMIN domain-containing protein [Anabaena lutea]MBD2569224.1 AMIN domain-containing protein [Anabaena lutea FACHB-196]